MTSIYQQRYWQGYYFILFGSSLTFFKHTGGLNGSTHLIAPEAWEGRNPRSRAGGKEEVNTVLQGNKKNKIKEGKSTIELAVFFIFTEGQRWWEEREEGQGGNLSLEGVWSLDTWSTNIFHNKCNVFTTGHLFKGIVRQFGKYTFIFLLRIGWEDPYHSHVCTLNMKQLGDT